MVIEVFVLLLIFFYQLFYLHHYGIKIFCDQVGYYLGEILVWLAGCVDGY